MENKEVQKALNNISDGSFDEEDIHCIGKYIGELEQEVKELNACIDRNEKSHLFFTNNQVKIIEKLEKQNKIYNDYFDDFTELFNSHDYKDNAILLDDIRNPLMNMFYKVDEVKENG